MEDIVKEQEEIVNRINNQIISETYKKPLFGGSFFGINAVLIIFTIVGTLMGEYSGQAGGFFITLFGSIIISSIVLVCITLNENRNERVTLEKSLKNNRIKLAKLNREVGAI